MKVFWRNVSLTSLFLPILLMGVVSAYGSEAPGSLVFQGRIFKPDNTPLEDSLVSFDVRILNPGGSCLLYEETHNLNMTGSGGSFTLPLGLGISIGPSYTIKEVFSNLSSYTGGGSCAYSPASGDGRVIHVTFDDGSGAIALQDQTINSVPYALYASKLEGMGKNDFLQINTSTSNLSQANANSLFQNSVYTELMALAAGTSTQFAKSSDLPVSSGVLNLSGAGQGVRLLDAPAGADYAVNKNYADLYVGGRAVDSVSLAGLSSGESIKWDSTANSGAGGWVRYTPATSGSTIRTCEIVIGDSGAASLALADDNDTPSVCANQTGSTMTILSVECYANAGSPTVNPIISGGSATSILSSPLTCGTGVFASGTLNGTPTQTDGQTIDGNIATAGGTAKYVVIRIKRTL